MDLNMIGPALSLGLSAIGASIGSGVAGMAFHGVAARVDEGHGKFIAMLAMPSSMVMYGFILMLIMKKSILAGTLSAISGIFIGLSCGAAIGVAAIYQGLCAVSGIQASARNPSFAGKSFVPLGIVESFAIFVLIFGIMLT